ncbi:hypothetical protein [Planococcus lenghuensis]|uniref:Uncharacterized protein n=1 Tax=Planococcus lenghuensis TaxID=2213202 RepID=A0A1Q2L2Z8_9BACL|nr:hypothetical protein [Planococcus lenghuensis]AQQ54838.1 hypothetical protein B0X71_18180 [Planococcus lenghuensis]
MNAEQTERLLKRACAMIEVDQELKVRLRAALLTRRTEEDKTKLAAGWLLRAIDSLSMKPQPSLRVSIAPWL